MKRQAPPRLIAITDVATHGERLVLERFESVASLAKPGSVMLQLRDRGLPLSERYQLGRRLCNIARQHQQLCVINDRLDLALCLGADGAHLGELSVSPAEARRLLGGEAWLSAACHDPAAVASQGLAQADLVILSPVFEARKGNLALGEDVLARGQQQLSGAGRGQTLVALGGVDAVRAERVARLGVSVAAIGAVLAPSGALTLLKALEIVEA